MNIHLHADDLDGGSISRPWASTLAGSCDTDSTASVTTTATRYDAAARKRQRTALENDPVLLLVADGDTFLLVRVPTIVTTDSSYAVHGRERNHVDCGVSVVCSA